MEKVIPFHSKGLLLWLFNVAGKNGTLLGLQVKCPIFGMILTKFGTCTVSPQYQILLKSVHMRAAMIYADRRAVDKVDGRAWRKKEVLFETTRLRIIDSVAVDVKSICRETSLSIAKASI
jgi:hypothetical protein